jgi:cytochrome c553
MSSPRSSGAMATTAWRFVLALSTTTILCACGGSEPAAVAPTPSVSSSQQVRIPPTPPEGPAALPPLDNKTKPDMPPPGSSLNRVMRAHFKDALLIRQAVIAGTPEKAANPATVLALIQNLDDLPPGWQKFVERMQQTAKRITDSTSSAQAAAATADLGVACGQCHSQQGGPAVSSEPPPVEGTSLEQRMKRHSWATDRLWEGLVVPSSEAWNAGSKALVDSPFPQAVLQRGVHARSAASDFKKLVVLAPAKKTIEERAALYAELLMTCGTCHRSGQETRAKPGT